MFHILVYEEALGVNAADSDLDAVPDDEFSRRNDHFILSEQFNLISTYYAAASATRARLNVPTINSIGRHNIWPVNVDADVPTDPDVQDLRDFPLTLPMNEEIAVEGSNNLGAATENSTCVMWIAPPAWNRNIPRGLQQLNVRATAATTGVAQAWSASGTITFADNLRGGWYAIIGAQAFDAGVIAWRFVFPKAPMYQGRKLRPGGIGQQAIAEKPWRPQSLGYGEYGRFHSFEPPQFQVYATAAGATTSELRLDVVYLGERGG